MASFNISVVPPAEGQTLQEQVYNQLRRLLMQGDVKPGQVISIRGAADALGVSMMPVRAALQRLETEGALVARGGKRMLGIPALSADTYRDVLDVRTSLEGMAAERAAARVSDEDVDRTRAHCQAMQAAAEAGDLAGYTVANRDFHFAIYRASRVTVLVGIIEGLWLRVGPYVPLMMPDRESLVASMPRHWAIVDALAHRDGTKARAGVVEDIRESATALLALLDRPQGEAKRKRRRGS